MAAELICLPAWRLMLLAAGCCCLLPNGLLPDVLFGLGVECVFRVVPDSRLAQGDAASRLIAVCLRNLTLSTAHANASFPARLCPRNGCGSNYRYPKWKPVQSPGEFSPTPKCFGHASRTFRRGTASSWPLGLWALLRATQSQSDPNPP